MVKKIEILLDGLNVELAQNENLAPSRIEVVCVADKSYDPNKAAEGLYQFLEQMPLGSLYVLFNDSRFQEIYRLANGPLNVGVVNPAPRSDN